MTEVVSIRFKNRGKSYYFDPRGHQVKTGQNVIVETSKGLEFGECARGNFSVEDNKVIPPLRPVIRLATAADLATAAVNKEKEQVAFSTCMEKIRELNLDMKLVDVEYNFEGTKILFFFTSDGRVDFRELVRDLAGVFRTRIELRQIGVRDEAKLLGGLGVCGKPFCCSQFLDEFQPVSIKMAKTQNLSLNPTKISGICGRLMCCLKYEQDAYEELVKAAPKVDSYVETPDGNGTITEINLLRQKAKVRMEVRGGDPVIAFFPLDQIQFIKTGKQRRAEILSAQAAGQSIPLATAPRRTLQRSVETPESAAPKQEGQKSDAPKPRFKGRPTEGQRSERPPQQAVPGPPSAQKSADGAEKIGNEAAKKFRKRRKRRPGGGEKPGGSQGSSQG